ncbi:hypothetical protein QP197_23775, partial [Escherichia coli]|nr:hypothetical protein [Escherichia coli]
FLLKVGCSPICSVTWVASCLFDNLTPSRQRKLLLQSFPFVCFRAYGYEKKSKDRARKIPYSVNFL